MANRTEVDMATIESATEICPFQVDRSLREAGG
jgi:hypothetical protein